jgi:hypothetical protein
MHAASGARRSQTVASMSSDLTPGQITHWVTGTAAPCLGLFKPVVLGMPMPNQGPPPTDRYDEASLWWRHERLHRAALADFPAAMVQIADERDALEARFRARMAEAWAIGEVAVPEAISACWREAESTEARWRRRLSGHGRSPNTLGRSGARAWARLNTVAGFPPA